MKKYILIIFTLLLSYTVITEASTTYLQYRMTTGQTNSGSPHVAAYPQPLIEITNTREGYIAGKVQLATQLCGEIQATVAPDSCGMEINPNGYCTWYVGCSSIKTYADMSWYTATCPDGTYPNPGTFGITCQSTLPQYCPDGETYNNLAGTCETPPPPPMPLLPDQKDLGKGCPGELSPQV